MENVVCKYIHEKVKNLIDSTAGDVGHIIDSRTLYFLKPKINNPLVENRPNVQGEFEL
jgi:hypothetical protein